MLTKTTDCKHVISRVPWTVWYKIKHFAFVIVRSELLFKTSIPKTRGTNFRTWNQVLTICTYIWSTSKFFADRAKESFFYSSASCWLIFNQTNTIVAWVNKQLVQMFRMNPNWIYFVTIEFSWNNLKVIFSNKRTISKGNIPHRNLTSGIASE